MELLSLFFISLNEFYTFKVVKSNRIVVINLITLQHHATFLYDKYFFWEKKTIAKLNMNSKISTMIVVMNYLEETRKFIVFYSFL
jgi:hypothetical protein